MAKFFGPIGYAILKETTPGVWKEVITEHNHYGDVIQWSRRSESSGDINDNINITNEISIVADPFANENMRSMRYVKFMGANWKVSNIRVQYPRLILTIGGLYNGKQATSAK